MRESDIDALFQGVLSVLSSGQRMRILDAVSQGVDHPDDLAALLGVTRQAVDKHLTLLYHLGMVERSAAYPPDGRPRIVYTVTRPARDLLIDLKERVQRYAALRAMEYRERQEDLDARLAVGELSEPAYRKRSAALRRRYGVG